MSSDEKTPFVHYQAIDLDVDMQNETIDGVTTLWLLYSKPVEAGRIIHLHNRCLVSEVLVNGVASDFSCRDALSALYYDSTRVKNYLGREADVNYKAALELSRDGELQIVVPDWSKCASTADSVAGLEDLPELPTNVPAELQELFDKLRSPLDMCRTEMRDLAEEAYQRRREKDGGGGDDDNDDETGEGADVDACRLLQVRIRYSVPRAPEHASCGIIFRRSVASKLAATCDARGAWKSVGTKGPAPAQVHGPAVDETEAVCLYTIGAGGEGILRDVDGVRCWVPCLDTPEQRTHFDVTVRTQGNLTVLCSGRQVSRQPVMHASFLSEVTGLRRVESRLGKPEATPVPRFMTRYVTSTRMPAFSLGLFAGVVEEHKVPLYKVRGTAWVALGLADTVKTASAQGNERDDSAGNSGRIGSHRGVGRGRGDSITSDPPDAYYETIQRERKRARLQGGIGSHGSSVGGDSVDDEDPSTPNRRLRSLSFGAVRSPDSSLLHPGPADAADDWTPGAMRDGSVWAPGAMLDGSVYPSAPLYEAALRHTVGSSGLDMSLRLLHKFVGHSYDHENYTQVFIEGLGDNFLSFDGFSLLDAHLLHTEEQVYMETPVHLLLLRAYLYSWLMVAMPLDSFDSGFVLHGVVGYLQDFYVDQVYGEEDGMARLQKYADMCNELEKLGFGFPLTSGHPDSHDHFSPYRRAFWTAKSTVLFHLLETHIGGRDSMRLAIKNMVRSSSLYKACKAPPVSLTVSNGSAGGGDSGLDVSLSRQSSTASAYGATPFHSVQMSSSLSTPYPLLCLTVPNSGLSTLKRQDPIATEIGWERDPLMVLTRNCVSVDAFFAELRTCATSIIDMPEDFAQNFIHSSGTHLLYITAALEARPEGRPRNFTIAVSSVSCNNGQVAKGLVPPMELKIRIVEQRDDMATDCTILTNDGLDSGETHVQPIHMRQATRHRVRRRKGLAKPSPAQEMEMAEKQSRDKLRHRRLREHLMDSLELAREMEHPVKYICPDPSSAGMFEAHLQLPDPMLIELLFSEQHDAHDVLRHILALRSLGRMSHIGNVTNSIELSSPAMLYDPQTEWRESKGPPRSSRLQLKALSDCLMGSCFSSNRDARCITGPHHLSVRVEAAFALAAWQNNRAPRQTLIDTEGGTGRNEVDPWAALSILLAALRDMFMTGGLALPIDPTSEKLTTLRYSLLLAISSVRSQQGFTPQPAIEAIVHFARCCDEFEGPKNGAFAERGRPKGPTTDNSHYKGVLLLALSQLRPEPSSGAGAGSGAAAGSGYAYTKVLGQIRELAKHCLQNDWTVARTTARIAARSVETSRMPCLALSGGITALCLHCLAELDMYYMQVETVRGIIDVGHMHRQLHTGCGPFTGVNYCAYFLPVGTTIGAMRVEEDGISEKFFATCPAVVRAAALEATTRLLFATHVAAWDRACNMTDPQAKNVETSRVKGMACVATAMAAIFTVIENESSRWTRRQAALTLQNAILDRGARLPHLVLALGDVGGCIKWSDPESLSLRPSRVSDPCSRMQPQGSIALV